MNHPLGSRLPHSLSVAAALAIAAAALLMVVTPARSEEDLFETTAARFFARYCVECHNSTATEGGLDLTRESGVRQGGDTGNPLDSERWQDSLLWDRVQSGEMPPESATSRPSPEDRQDLGRWLAAGAPWPAERLLSPFEVTTANRAGRDWWSLQPLQADPYPADSTEWAAHRFDSWIEQQRRERGLSGASPADRRQLIRRLTFDLHGLPPTPEEVVEFVADERPDAYERQVDRLLASPRYGEHWARHWLDIARFGDTHGYERDFPRNHAWRYRDFVIQALNADQPYDEFVRWQIAGDVVAPDSASGLIATAFLACGPYDFTGLNETQSPPLRRMARADELDDILTTTIAATLGLTINCARCHTHKFDPISQADYYAMASLLGGIKREDRPVESEGAREQRERQTAELQRRLAEINSRLQQLESSIDLADIVGGGDGTGTGRREQGIDPRTGAQTHGEVPMLEEVQVNRLVRGASRFVDAVLVPDGGSVTDGLVAIDSQGHQVKLPDTSGASWDYFQNGPVHSQAFTELDGVDYAGDDHSLLGMHANKLITFDLQQIREVHNVGELTLTAIVGYGGREESASADVLLLLDAKPVFEQPALKRADGGISLEVPLPETSRFLTLVATEGKNGIGHDQVFFGDARLRPALPRGESELERQRQVAELTTQRDGLRERLEQLENVPQVFGITSVDIEPTYVHLRGNPESHGPPVGPATLEVYEISGSAKLTQEASDQERRLAFASWITSPDNGLFARVIVNRLWHYHFGSGLVNTPSDFGFYGGRPSHPELLESLAMEMRDTGWSLKQLHRQLLCTSTYRQSSAATPANLEIDADNRLLWRYSPRRLSAESIRDSVLAVAGTLNGKMGGPGFREFELEERYAPIYRYVDEDRPEFWRRSIYRFAVRSVPNQFMEVLDCPNPSTVAPKRSETTTALQALAMFNDPLMLSQAEKFATRLNYESQGNSRRAVERAFALAFGRPPSNDELAKSLEVVSSHGLAAFSRALFNANEFLYLE